MANHLGGARAKERERESAQQKCAYHKREHAREHNEPGEFGPGAARATFINFYESLAIIYS
jgi:hypothetical protein